jgi:hypothetical protein
MTQGQYISLARIQKEGETVTVGKTMLVGQKAGAHGGFLLKIYTGLSRLKLYC